MSTEPEAPPPFDPAPLLAVAERVLAQRFGGTVRLSAKDVLRERYRNRVFRAIVEEGPEDVPSSVIVKTAEGSEEKPYDPENDEMHSPAWRFYNEWTGNAFLDTLNADPPPGAGFLGGDRAAGMIILKDLGAAGESLADRMQAADLPALEDALRSYAASMGRLHALSVGKEDEFLRLRGEAGGKETVRERDGVRWGTEIIPLFKALCAAVGVELASDFDDEVAQVQKEVNEPGPFLAFAPGDTCPDNHRLTETPYLRFFDFEFAGFRHALLDAAYFYLPFPTCWCVNRLPDTMVAEMEAVYRQELVKGIPEAADDALFSEALLKVRAFWTITSVSWDWESRLKEDSKWGISSVWQRHLLRLENFARATEQVQGPMKGLPALGETAGRLASALRERWKPEEEMPLYPAFRPQETK
jgi:hypothetical protein